jgi:hypothetical protein
VVLSEVTRVQRSEDGFYSLEIFFSCNLQYTHLNFLSAKFFSKHHVFVAQIVKFCNKVTIYFQNPQIANKFSQMINFLWKLVCYLQTFITKKLLCFAKCCQMLRTWNMTPLLKLNIHVHCSRTMVAAAPACRLRCCHRRHCCRHCHRHGLCHCRCRCHIADVFVFATANAAAAAAATAAAATAAAAAAAAATTAIITVTVVVATTATTIAATSATTTTIDTTTAATITAIIVIASAINTVAAILLTVDRYRR